MITPGGRPHTILLVEDVDWVRAGVGRTLRRHGYRVVEARDDAEAVEAALRESPNLILTEEELPAFDALAARLRGLPEHRRVPVVIVNPDADENTRHGDAIVLASYDRLRDLLLCA